MDFNNHYCLSSQHPTCLFFSAVELHCRAYTIKTPTVTLSDLFFHCYEQILYTVDYFDSTTRAAVNIQ